MRIDEQIKIVCIKNEITMAEIARRLGITPQAFSQKMRRGTFSLDNLENIALVAGCKLECHFVMNNGDKVTIV